MPATLAEIIAGSHNEAMTAEANKFYSMRVFGKTFTSEEEARNAGYQVIDLKMINTWKLGDDGLRKPKSRMVVRGFQDRDYAEVSCALPSIANQRLLLVEAAIRGQELWQFDVGNAY